MSVIIFQDSFNPFWMMNTSRFFLEKYYFCCPKQVTSYNHIEKEIKSEVNGSRSYPASPKVITILYLQLKHNIEKIETEQSPVTALYMQVIYCFIRQRRPADLLYYLYSSFKIHCTILIVVDMELMVSFNNRWNLDMI